MSPRTENTKAERKEKYHCPVNARFKKLAGLNGAAHKPHHDTDVPLGGHW